MDIAGLVLLDVEHAGSLEVTGPEASSILHSMVVELSTARWSDQACVVVIGFDMRLDHLERVRGAPAVRSVLAEVRWKIEERRALVDIVGRSSSWASRWTGSGDA